MTINVVLDVNVLVSGYNFEGVEREIIRHWNGLAFELYVSDHIIETFDDVLNRPYFSRLVNPERRQIILDRLRSQAERVDPAEGIHGVADDDEDDLILATAVAANADYLVTGDKGLLALGAFQGIPIMTPRAFLDRLVQEG
jgi:putative PIN family toxin of toxin-antitoxin system